MNAFQKEKEGNGERFRRRHKRGNQIASKEAGIRKDISGSIIGVDLSRFGDFTVWTDVNGNFHTEHNK